RASSPMSDMSDPEIAVPAGSESARAPLAGHPLPSRRCPAPACGRPLTARQREACSARCRAALSRERQARALEDRDQEILARIERMQRTLDRALFSVGEHDP